MATLNFNANDVAPSVGFEPIPEAKYMAIVSESEMKPTKNGNGSYLELVFQVIEGQYKGRQLWTRLNLDNPTAKAVEIAKAELSAICRAVNVMQPQDSVELHNLPLEIDVKCRKRPDTGEITNEIKGYYKPGSKNGGNGAAVATNAAAVPPWQRKG